MFENVQFLEKSKNAGLPNPNPKPNLQWSICRLYVNIHKGLLKIKANSSPIHQNIKYLQNVMIIFLNISNTVYSFIVYPGSLKTYYKICNVKQSDPISPNNK